MKPKLKPVVFNLVKPCKKQRLTLKQYKTKQYSMGFSSTKTKTHTLEGLPHKGDFLFCFFSLCGKLFRFRHFLSTYPQFPAKGASLHGIAYQED